MYEHFSRRPKEVEDAIIASWEPSKVHKNVFSKDETKQLINLFKKAPKAGSGVANYKMFDDSLNVADFEHTLAKRRPNPGETATACSAHVSWDTGALQAVAVSPGLGLRLASVCSKSATLRESSNIL